MFEFQEEMFDLVNELPNDSFEEDGLARWCLICPNGLEVDDSTVIIGESLQGITCSDIVIEALNYDALSVSCSLVKDAELTCCPNSINIIEDNIQTQVQITSLPTTSKPTLPPTVSPTSTKSPSDIPSFVPSRTTLPSYIPSTASPTSTEQSAGLQVTFAGIGYIPDVNEWEENTARYYESIYEEYDIFENTIVEITLTNQNTQRTRTRTLREKERMVLLLQHEDEREKRRMLQTTSSPDPSVEVTYIQTTTFTGLDSYSDANSMNADEILQLPLSTDEYREGYINQLKLLEGYEELTTISSISTSNGNDNDDDLDGTDADGGGGLSTGSILGILLGGAAILTPNLLVGVLYWRSRKYEHQGSIINTDTGHGVNTHHITATSNKKRHPKETYGDMSVGSDDFDNDEVNVAEELLTVRVCAGKLGIVLDSPDNGAPVIHDLKETSPISDKVRIGDRLVAVDDEDVRNMTAIKASKLISRNSGSSRKLTVIRYLPG